MRTLKELVEEYGAPTLEPCGTARFKRERADAIPCTRHWRPKLVLARAGHVLGVAGAIITLSLFLIEILIIGIVTLATNAAPWAPEHWPLILGSALAEATLLALCSTLFAYFVYGNRYPRIFLPARWSERHFYHGHPLDHAPAHLRRVLQNVLLVPGTVLVCEDLQQSFVPVNPHDSIGAPAACDECQIWSVRNGLEQVYVAIWDRRDNAKVIPLPLRVVG